MKKLLAVAVLVVASVATHAAGDRPSDSYVQGACEFPVLNSGTDTTQLQCDIYNGHPTRTLEKITIRAEWRGQSRDLDADVYIRPHTASRISFNIGGKIPLKSKWRWHTVHEEYWGDSSFWVYDESKPVTK